MREKLINRAAEITDYTGRREIKSEGEKNARISRERRHMPPSSKFYHASSKCVYIPSIESDSPTNLTSCQAESRLVVPSFPPRYVKTNANVVYGEICRSKCVGDMQIAEGRVWTEGGWLQRCTGSTLSRESVHNSVQEFAWRERERGLAYAYACTK